jgi:RNA polymerase sigma-70 factor, ECF subfamily
MYKKSSKKDVSDHDLMREFLVGEVDAFGRLFEKHRHQLIATAVTYLKNMHDAEDVVQICFYLAMRGASGFRFEAAVATWLNAILIHACIDSLKSKNKLGTLFPLELMFENDALVDPSEYLEMRTDLQLAFDDLPIEQKQVIFVTEIHGLSTKEAAAIIGCPMGTIKSRRARALAKIRRQVRLLDWVD